MFPDVPTQPLDEPPLAPVSTPIVLPTRLPAQCFLTAARDYVLPPMILVAIVKHESKGHSVAHLNSNGTVDSGVAQINDASWGRYMAARYNITTQALMVSPCQSIRVMAYALRMEMNHAECGGIDVWCGVGRYHSPNNSANRAVYVPKVRSALVQIERTRRFE